MATTEQIDQLVSAIPTQPQAFFDLIEIYLDQDTTAEQHTYIRQQLQQARHQITYLSMSERSLEDQIRIYLARQSIFEGYDDPNLDPRDLNASYNRFIKTVVEPAIHDKISVLKIIHEISSISTRAGKSRIATFEETYRHLSKKIQIEEAARIRQARQGKQPEQEQTQSPAKSKKSKSPQKSPSRFGDDINLDLPRRHWLSPRLRFGFTTIFVGIIAIVVITEGEDARSVIFLYLIFLAVVAALSWTYYNRDWGK